MLRVYLVEDDFAFAEKFINEAISGGRVNVVGCAAGPVADDIKNTAPDVIVVGTGNATQTAKDILRELPGAAILFSVPADRHNIESYRHARNNGAGGILRRPYSVAELTDAAETAAGMSPAEPDGREKQGVSSKHNQEEPEPAPKQSAPQAEKPPQKKTVLPAFMPIVPKPVKIPEAPAFPPSVIAVFSPWIPRIGVTRLAIQIAGSLAAKNRDATAMVDADLRGRGLGVRLGVSPGELKAADWRLAKEPHPAGGGRLLAWLMDPFNTEQPVSDSIPRDIVIAAGRRHRHTVVDAGCDPDARYAEQVLRHTDGAVLLAEPDLLSLARILPRWERGIVPCPFVIAAAGADEEGCLELAEILGAPCRPLQREGDGFSAGDIGGILAALSAEMARAPRVRQSVPPVYVVGVGGGRADAGPVRHFRTEAEFKKATEETIPSAIIVSASMPGAKELVKNLRRSFSLNTVPIGVLGGGTEFYDAGADGLYDAIDASVLDDLAARRQRIHAVWDDAARDDLTGCFRRTAMEKHLEAEAERYLDNSIPFAVIMLDIDRFKAVNDTYGHQAGDLVLKEFGAFLLSSVRETDMVARYGGEEFVLVFPRTKAEDAARAAEEMLLKWRQKEVFLPGGKVLKTTFSAGVAQFGRHSLSTTGIIAAADKALYRAKEEGRSRVILA